MWLSGGPVCSSICDRLEKESEFRKGMWGERRDGVGRSSVTMEEVAG